MRLTVVGATGKTGGHVLRQALDTAHHVTALARDPSRIDRTHPRLHVVQGDVLDPTCLQPAVQGSDAVASTLASGSGRGPITLYSQGTANLIQAMRAAGTCRLLVVSAAPVAPDEPADTVPYRLLVKPLLHRFLGDAYTDMARMEELVRASGLDWTILRAPRLTDKPATGRYRIAVETTVRRGYSLSRADLAAAILRFLHDPDTVKATIAIAN